MKTTLQVHIAIKGVKSKTLHATLRKKINVEFPFAPPERMRVDDVAFYGPGRTVQRCVLHVGTDDEVRLLLDLGGIVAKSEDDAKRIVEDWAGCDWKRV